ncbi:hypothetical protein [Devosia sp. Leaf64]|uniref:hypothetical protein n=1 Tax=Devosia sp. Leaf64 TaxID=1736229 RepID=UPI000712937C|nr:hypothetical protein [Devosia sp. Leaf64]KQN75044.1 hypothetical protein ASE94_01620 [Devosia sp. Leaf64]
MTVLSSKIDNLAATLAVVGSNDLADFTNFFHNGLDRGAVVVGSGGSTATAMFFARSRDTRGAPPTIIRTPLEFVLDNFSLAGTPVWLFTARGENPDIDAALSAAVKRMASEIYLVTSNPDTSIRSRFPSILKTIVVPVADPKDGFLSTHSLMSAVWGTLLASSSTMAGSGQNLLSALDAMLLSRIAADHRTSLGDALVDIGMKEDDTILVLHDPSLLAAAVTIETSIWEAALGSVQRVDFRNFAHGRHTWFAKNLESTTVIALTGHATRRAWEDLRTRLPSSMRSIALDYGNCGRFSAAKAVLDALLLVEAIGRRVNIDPGKPGVGEFAKSIYEAPSLIELEQSLSGGARKKLAAVLEYDSPDHPQADIVMAHSAATASLAGSRFSGLVLDYDGTMVSTDQRLEPASREIVGQLVRLLDEGMNLAFATGRGGSGCRALRAIIPPQHWDDVLVGYYNGSWLRPLSVDIEAQPADPDNDLDPAIAWLSERTGLFNNGRKFRPTRQITIRLSELVSPAEFNDALENASFLRDGSVRMVRSGHSIDIISAASSKTNVVRHVQSAIGTDLSVLCVGDSGDIGGNDFELLGYRHGISVGRVCHRADCCWPLFGDHLTGPDALLAILKGLRQSSHGVFNLTLDDALE